MRRLISLAASILLISLPEFSDADDRTIIRCLEMLDSRSFDAIISYCDDCIRVNPKDSFPYLFRGMAHRNKKEFEEAMQDFQQVIRLDPKNAPGYNQLGITMLQKHGFQIEPKEKAEAIRNFTKAIELDPQYAEAYQQRARCYALHATFAKEGAEETKKALADYDQVIKLRPRDSDAYGGRAFLHAQRGNLDQAIADFDQAIRINPRNGFHLSSRGNLHLKQKQYERAVADFEASIRVGDGWYSKPALVWLLATCPDEKHRNGKRALELAEKGNFSERSGEWECLAAAYAELGRFDKATQWQKKAIDEGRPYVLKGGKEKAVERLRLYQQGKPYRAVP